MSQKLRKRRASLIQVEPELKLEAVPIPVPVPMVRMDKNHAGPSSDDETEVLHDGSDFYTVMSGL